ncbi:alpha-ketoglutarate-dependent dioxygenase alkB homolog 6 isoform X4 [Dermacentor albipictus]|uniref:alpha-ketoglutarate-dependent dioxygenase alkB homolog 6 isoform X4 n=1 Tax=Dermacentor albipictus TaxID=60249 RepID=UPI0038FCA096
MAAPMCGLAGDLDKFRIASKMKRNTSMTKSTTHPSQSGSNSPAGGSRTGWLKDISAKVASLGVFGEKLPNHVLVNEYKPGEGILPHEDGPLYYPVVTNITLNSSTVIDFYKPRKSTTCEVTADAKDTETNSHIGSLLLERRSLLITSGAMYTDYLHGIEGRTKDIIDDSIKNIDACSVKRGTVLQRETRVSLTIRVVPKVLRANVLQALFKK